MRILFFDDNRERHKLFQQNSIGAVVHHAYSVHEAIECLRKNSYDYIFLDYDMDTYMRSMSDSEFNTGMEVANYIIREHTDFNNSQIIVHSLNLVCGGDMATRLHMANLNVLHKPGAWKTVSIKDCKLVFENTWTILENE